MKSMLTRSLVALVVFSLTIVAVPSMVLAQSYGEGTYGGNRYNGAQAQSGADASARSESSGLSDSDTFPANESGATSIDRAHRERTDAPGDGVTDATGTERPSSSDEADADSRSGLLLWASFGAIAAALLVVIVLLARRRRSL